MYTEKKERSVYVSLGKTTPKLQVEKKSCKEKNINVNRDIDHCKWRETPMFMGKTIINIMEGGETLI